MYYMRQVFHCIISFIPQSNRQARPYYYAHLQMKQVGIKQLNNLPKEDIQDWTPEVRPQDS